MSSKRFCNNESLASSDSDEYHEVFYSSSSHDRSSVGSIPWAEDAIKQNQLEWERVERMFYGEEELPPESELRTEIIEWRKAFPHIRVCGKKIEASSSNCGSSSDTITEEIIETDSSEDNYLKKTARSAPKTNFYDCDDLSEIVAKDLRISSVPMLSKRRQLSAMRPQKETEPKRFIQIQSGPVQKYRGRQFTYSNSSGALLAVNKIVSNSRNNASSSARIVRLPPIMNFIVPQRTYLPHSTQLVLASKKKNPVILPIVNISRADYPEDVGNRSISAAMNGRQVRTAYLPNSASKIKIFK